MEDTADKTPQQIVDVAAPPKQAVVPDVAPEATAPETAQVEESPQVEAVDQVAREAEAQDQPQKHTSTFPIGIVVATVVVCGLLCFLALMAYRSS